MFGDETCRRTGVYNTPVSLLDHSADDQPREVKWSVEIDAYRLVPQIRVLLPDNAFMRRTYAVVANENFDRSQSLLCQSNG